MALLLEAYEKSLTDSIICQILHRITDTTLGLSQVQYSEFSEHFDIESWWNYTRECKKILLVSAARKLNANKIIEEFGDGKTTRVIPEVLASRVEDLRKALANEACSSAECYLKDFDWDVHLVLGSDKLSDIQEPSTTVKLDLREQGKRKEVSVEMNGDQLENFISTLEEISKEVANQQL